MNEKLLEALDEISDRHILEAAGQKRSRVPLLIRSAAAVLAVVLVLALVRPHAPTAAAVELVSPAAYETLPHRPRSDDYRDEEIWKAELEAWKQLQVRKNEEAILAAGPLGEFYRKSSVQFLTGTQNEVWSPAGAYYSLSMMAQITSGTTRQEILSVLGQPDLESLRQEVKALVNDISSSEWETHRQLAASVWLDRNTAYEMEALSILGSEFYASVFQTDLADPASAEQIRDWIAEKTHGQAAPQELQTHPNSVLKLITAMAVDDQWCETFDPERNTEGLFHAPNGDIRCTYLNGRDEMMLSYAEGVGYQCVGIDGFTCTLWLILPDEGTTPAQVLEAGTYLDHVLTTYETEPEEHPVNLTMPKFAIASETDLTGGLKALGITEAFAMGGDFSETFPGNGAWVDSLKQGIRLEVDEGGIRASSWEYEETITLSASEGGPIDFTLDRPFLFVLTTSDHGIPLYAGVVTQP